MLTAAEGIRSRIRGVSRVTFDADEDLQIIVTHLIEIISEAAPNVSTEFRAAHAYIPWADMIGMRHRLIHDYSNTELEQVWSTAAEDIPALIVMLEPLVAHEEPS